MKEVNPPVLFKIEGDKPAPLDWNQYSRGISDSFNLGLKWSVARNLLELVRLHSNPADCSTFARLWKGVRPGDMVVRQQMFAMQAIAVTMDLTENFAAMCFAYAEAVSNGPKFFPLLLRDFGNLKKKHYGNTGVNVSLGTAKAFYSGLLRDSVMLRKYLASPKDPTNLLLHKRQVVSEIVRFRTNYELWYNKFKHTNSVLAFEGLFDVPGSFSMLHRIPDHIKASDAKVTFKDEKLLASIVTDMSIMLGVRVSHLRSDSFLTAFQNLDDPSRVLGLLETFWQQIRRTQHKSLFGKEPPN